MTVDVAPSPFATVDPASNIGSHVHNGEDYYTRGLRARFLIDEDKAAAAAKSEPAADIEYGFDKEKFFARSKARVAAGGLAPDLPNGFPKAMEGPMVWTGKDFDDTADCPEYVMMLSDDDKREIFAAVKHFIDLGVDPQTVTRETFPLQTLGPRLDKARNDIYEGRGFFIVRGLDEIDDLNESEFTALYLGMSSYIAARRGKQDQRGSMLMHVVNRPDIPEENADNLDKPFHTDTVCDCLCLVTKNCAAKGGHSILASGWAVYNEIAATRPDIIQELAKPNWPFDTHGRNPAYYNRALLYHTDGKLIFNFSRRLLVGCNPQTPRTKGIPGLTEAQAEALDMVHYVATRVELRTRMVKGDMRFVNNMALIHRREAFEDDASSGDERHLIRLWLNSEERCWALPRPLRVAWARIFHDEERGENWDLAPPRNIDGVVIRVAGSCD